MADELEQNPKSHLLRSKILQDQMTFDESRYEFDDSFTPWDGGDPMGVHTTAEMIACLEKNANIELEAKILTLRNQRFVHQTVGKTAFLEGFKKNAKMKETDYFASDDSETGVNSGSIGDDPTNFLGGPFYKNLYFYQDYIRMHARSFYAYHHDPVAKAIALITRDFTLGRGYRVDSDNDAALALWNAFEQANDIEEMMRDLAIELTVYGEVMLWWLPNHESKITFALRDKSDIPHGILPRVRLIDPSNIVEIVTYPEDITRRLFYVWQAPTQYQIYSGQDQDKKQPTLKFIYRQIPASEMLHFKVNGVSNEKRGRSDFYPVLGYMKRLRDSVNYSLVGMQKQTAWAIDTTIQGSQTDVDNYVQAMAALGTIPPTGSDFVHTDKIKREYLSNQLGRGGSQEIFEWCWSMICSGVQIPMNYFGTHISGGQTRASAIVATEPVAKKFEMRQLVYDRVIRQLWDRLMKESNIQADCEITWPEIITQDRSAKLKDLALAETQQWISKRRASEIASKELGITDYDYEDEQKELKEDPAPIMAPLTAPPAMGAEPTASPSAITGTEKRDIAAKDQYA